MYRPLCAISEPGSRPGPTKQTSAKGGMPTRKGGLCSSVLFSPHLKKTFQRLQSAYHREQEHSDNDDTVVLAYADPVRRISRPQRERLTRAVMELRFPSVPPISVLQRFHKRLLL